MGSGSRYRERGRKTLLKAFVGPGEGKVGGPCSVRGMDIGHTLWSRRTEWQ